MSSSDCSLRAFQYKPQECDLSEVRKQPNIHTAQLGWVMVACSHYNPSLFFFRPGLLATSASNYPWLADSWPATNLLRNGKPKEAAVTCCPGAHNPSERYYNGKRFNLYFGVRLLIKQDLMYHNKISLLILNIENCPQTTRNRYFF